MGVALRHSNNSGCLQSPSGQRQLLPRIWLAGDKQDSAPKQNERLLLRSPTERWRLAGALLLMGTRP